MRDVATCPELSCGRCANDSERMSSDSKASLANNGSPTDTGQSVAPTVQSSGSPEAKHLSPSRSVPDVSKPRVNFAVARTGHQVQRSADISGNRTNVSDIAGATVDRAQPQRAASVAHPPVINVTEALTGASAAAVASGGVADSPSLKRTHDETSETADLASESKVMYHKDADQVAMDTSASTEHGAGLVGSTSDLTAGNKVCTDKDLLSDETVTVTPVRHVTCPAFAAGMPYMDESVDMSDCTDQSVTVTVDEESNMSVTEGGQLGQPSPAVDEADRTLCCSSAISRNMSNDETHSTIDEMHLVSNLCSSFSLFSAVCARVL